MSARTYDCRACGAQVDEHARRCRYCAAPVATVRCAICFYMSVPEAGFCAGCGSELGLEPLGEEATLPCPLCKAPLAAFRDAVGSIFDCGACGGQFVEHARFREMLRRHERADVGAPLPRGLPDPRTHYIPCPACASLMNRKNFAGVSGVILDVCKSHGTWFDQGELPRVLAFVAAGGLAHSKKREAEERARAARAARVAAAELPSPASHRDPLFEGAASHGLAELLVDLLLR